MYYIYSYFINNTRAKDVQEIILVSPMGVSKLIDMLSDSREVIRNNVSTKYDNYLFILHFRYFFSVKLYKSIITQIIINENI